MMPAHHPLFPALAALLLAGCGQSAPPANEPAEVGVVTLTAAPVTLISELAGRTTAFMTSEVRPQVAGIIKARLFREGDLVHAGQPLYQIDAALYRATADEAAAQLANASATWASAKAKAARYRNLAGTEAVGKQDTDDAISAAGVAQAQVGSARATLQTAKINLGYTVVTAPITGRIGRSSATPGALVTASQTTALSTIQRLDPIYVDIAQSSAKLLELRDALANGGALPATTTVKLILENGKSYARSGTIEFGESVVDEATGTVTIRARFPNPDGILLPGMFVRAVTPEMTLRNAILAPQDGITRDAKGSATALIVDINNKVGLRTVTTDRAIGSNWLISAGLKAGDRLIVEGVDKTRAGATVKPVTVTLNKAG